MEQKVHVPGLMVMAEDDIVLSPAMADGMETYVPDLEKALINDCGHWTQQEHPGRTQQDHDRLAEKAVYVASKLDPPLNGGPKSLAHTLPR